MTKGELYLKLRRLRLEVVRDAQVEPDSEFRNGRMQGVNDAIDIVHVYFKEEEE